MRDVGDKTRVTLASRRFTSSESMKLPAPRPTLSWRWVEPVSGRRGADDVEDVARAHVPPGGGRRDHRVRARRRDVDVVRVPVAARVDRVFHDEVPAGGLVALLELLRALRIADALHLARREKARL